MNKAKLKRMIILFLAALMLIPAFTACAKAEAGKSSDIYASSAANTETVIDTTPRISPALPEENYDGYTFNFLTRWLDHADWIGVWNPVDFYAETENGEPINDAVYRRNIMVEEAYNITIAETQKEVISGNFDAAVKSTILAGDNAYDVIGLNTRALSTYVTQDYFVDLNTINYLDFDQPYWDNNVNTCTLAGKLYFAQGDMLINYKDATSAMVFNKQLVNDYNIESPYDMVRKGTWTFDKLLTLTDSLSKDLNGDSKMTYEDQFGYIIQYDSMESLFNAAGELIASKDGDDLPVITMSSDRALSVIERIFDIMYSDQSINVHHIPDLGNGQYAISQAIFKENRATFMWIRLAVVEELRGMEVDFGIIPLPKYDEAQESYYATVNPSTSYCLTVPVTAPDLDRTGIILEALNSVSRYTVASAYYDICLKGKYVRDEESSEMLELIFNSTVYDLGQVFNFGDISVSFLYMPQTQGNRNWVSKYASIEKKVNADIAKLVNSVTGQD